MTHEELYNQLTPEQRKQEVIVMSESNSWKPLKWELEEDYYRNPMMEGMEPVSSYPLKETPEDEDDKYLIEEMHNPTIIPKGTVFLTIDW